MKTRFPHLVRILQFFKRPALPSLPPRVVLPPTLFTPRPPRALGEPGKAGLKIPHLSPVKVREGREGPQATLCLRMVGGATFILFLYFIFFSPIFVVRGVEVRGNHLVSEEKILEGAFGGDFKARRYLILPSSPIKRSLLKSILQIESVTVSRNIFRGAAILTVAERATAIIWQTNNEKFLINRQGIVYDYAPLDSPLPVIEDLKNVPIDLGQRVVTEEFVNFVTAMTSNFALKADTTISRITIPETTFEVEVETEKGFKVIFDTTRSADAQLDNLVKVLQVVGDEPLQYVDLRIADRIYYK